MFVNIINNKIGPYILHRKLMFAHLYIYTNTRHLTKYIMLLHFIFLRLSMHCIVIAYFHSSIIVCTHVTYMCTFSHFILTGNFLTPLDLLVQIQELVYSADQVSYVIKEACKATVGVQSFFLIIRPWIWFMAFLYSC